MSRYDDLAKKAVDWSERFHTHRETCSQFAQWIAGQYAGYLDAPKERIQFVELDHDLHGTNKLTAMTQIPVMVVGKDGFQYFGLSVAFQTSTSSYRMSERMALGLQKSETAWHITWNDTRYDMPFSDVKRVSVLFDAWVKMAEDMYNGPVTRNSKAMGFVPLE